MAARKKKYTHYHTDRSIWAKGFMAAGNMEGHWEWFRKDGSKMRSGTLKSGKRVGKWITYDKKGRIHKITKMD